MRLTGSEGVYTLETSSGKSITLTGEEAAQLADVGRQVRDLLRSQRTQRYVPAPAIEVRKATVDIDAHHTQAVLLLEDKEGVETGYVLSLDRAKALRDGLENKIRQIESSAAGRTKQ